MRSLEAIIRQDIQTVLDLILEEGTPFYYATLGDILARGIFAALGGARKAFGVVPLVIGRTPCGEYATLRSDWQQMTGAEKMEAMQSECTNLRETVAFQPWEGFVEHWTDRCSEWSKLGLITADILTYATNHLPEPGRDTSGESVPELSELRSMSDYLESRERDNAPA